MGNNCWKRNIFHLKLPSLILRGHERWDSNFTCIIAKAFVRETPFFPDILDRVCASSFSTHLHLSHADDFFPVIGRKNKRFLLVEKNEQAKKIERNRF